MNVKMISMKIIISCKMGTAMDLEMKKILLYKGVPLMFHFQSK